jgi:hypothetical protein
MIGQRTPLITLASDWLKVSANASPLWLLGQFKANFAVLMFLRVFTLCPDLAKTCPSLEFLAHLAERSCELLPSLGVCRLLTFFYIWISPDHSCGILKLFFLWFNKYFLPCKPNRLMWASSLAYLAKGDWWRCVRVEEWLVEIVDDEGMFGWLLIITI